jgi:hypothetical protein
MLNNSQSADKSMPLALIFVIIVVILLIGGFGGPLLRSLMVTSVFSTPS